MIYLYYITENERKTWCYSRNYAPLLENQKRYGLSQYSNIRVYRVFNISSIIGQICLKTDKNVRLMIYLYYMTENERKTWCYSRNYAPLLENQKRYGLLQYSNIRVYRVFNKSLIIGQLCLKTDKNVRLMRVNEKYICAMIYSIIWLKMREKLDVIQGIMPLLPSW